MFSLDRLFVCIANNSPPAWHLALVPLENVRKVLDLGGLPADGTEDRIATAKSGPRLGTAAE